MGNRGYLSNFECGMVVVGVNIAETADLLGSPTQPSPEFLDFGLKN